MSIVVLTLITLLCLGVLIYCFLILRNIQKMTTYIFTLKSESSDHFTKQFEVAFKVQQSLLEKGCRNLEFLAHVNAITGDFDGDVNDLLSLEGIASIEPATICGVDTGLPDEKPTDAADAIIKQYMGRRPN